MSEKAIKVFFILYIILLCNLKFFAQNNKLSEFDFVYVALSQEDNTDYNKLINELKKLNSKLRMNHCEVVLYFTKGTIQFDTDNLDEWVNLYHLINGNSIAQLYADKEINYILNVFSHSEFLKIIDNKISSLKYNNTIWYIFIGNGYFQSDNNQNILGKIIASCNINDSSGFKLNFYHDSNDSMKKFNIKNALGKYNNFITDNIKILKEY